MNGCIHLYHLCSTMDSIDAWRALILLLMVIEFLTKTCKMHRIRFNCITVCTVRKKVHDDKQKFIVAVFHITCCSMPLPTRTFFMSFDSRHLAACTASSGKI